MYPQRQGPLGRDATPCGLLRLPSVITITPSPRQLPPQPPGLVSEPPYRWGPQGPSGVTKQGFLSHWASGQPIVPTPLPVCLCQAASHPGPQTHAGSRRAQDGFFGPLACPQWAGVVTSCRLWGWGRAALLEVERRGVACLPLAPMYPLQKHLIQRPQGSPFWGVPEVALLKKTARSWGLDRMPPSTPL